MISYDDACRVIALVDLRFEHGDLPDATLAAIYDYGTIPGAIKALKAARPETAEAAREIVLPYSRAQAQDDEEPLDDCDTTPVDDIPDTKPEAKTQETSAAAAAAADTVRQDFGPRSTAEHERLNTVIAEDAAKIKMLEVALAGRDREIKRLEEEIAATKKDTDLPKISAKKHIEALVGLLKKISTEGQLEAIADLCCRLKLEPLNVITISDSEAARVAANAVEAFEYREERKAEKAAKKEKAALAKTGKAA
jgi:hypothetical protein